MKIKVELVSQYTGTGKYIRKATKVTFPNGKSVTFTERVPKKMAIEQAERILKRG